LEHKDSNGCKSQCGNSSSLPLEMKVKVHLGPYLISMIENNPNKSLIVSMSIKKGFRYLKKEKRKKRPLILIYSNEWSLKELKRVFKSSFIFLSIETPYY
jgi:hypothetical protein